MSVTAEAVATVTETAVPGAVLACWGLNTFTSKAALLEAIGAFITLEQSTRYGQNALAAKTLRAEVKGMSEATLAKKPLDVAAAILAIVEANAPDDDE
jgi:hypothetical protein